MLRFIILSLVHTSRSMDKQLRLEPLYQQSSVSTAPCCVCVLTGGVLSTPPTLQSALSAMGACWYSSMHVQQKPAKQPAFVRPAAIHELNVGQFWNSWSNLIFSLYVLCFTLPITKQVKISGFTEKHWWQIKLYPCIPNMLVSNKIYNILYQIDTNK